MSRQEPEQSARRSEWEEVEAARAEDRAKLIGIGPGRGGLAAYEVVLILIAFAGVALAVEEMDSWTQWVVVAAIVLSLLAMLINLNLRRAN
jgi:hypothetical protein